MGYTHEENDNSWYNEGKYFLQIYKCTMSLRTQSFTCLSTTIRNFYYHEMCRFENGFRPFSTVLFCFLHIIIKGSFEDRSPHNISEPSLSTSSIISTSEFQISVLLAMLVKKIRCVASHRIRVLALVLV